MEKQVPIWAKVILLFFVVTEFFRYEKEEGKSFFDRPVRFTHFNATTNRTEKTYGRALEIGSQIYTVYYRLWFKPFEVRDGLVFDAFTDPSAGDTVYIDPWTNKLTNPRTKKQVPLDNVRALLKELETV